jgi:hypothetical protein
MERRSFLNLLGSSLAVLPGVASSQPASGPRRPDPQAFESGDLIWPKKEGAFVPYASAVEETTVDDNEMQWKKERADFIRRARAGQIGSSPEEIAYWKRVADKVELLDFIAFYHAYAANSSPNAFITYGGGEFLYVGHVAIVLIDPDSGKPLVVEAVTGKGMGCEHCVSLMPYDKWLESRGDILVWHARLKNLPAKDRAAVAAYARGKLGRPYDFWNFDLSSDTAFYCSKLVWQSVRQATGVAMDGNDDPRRDFWYSPLQAMKSPHLQILSSPGRYRND